MRGLLLGKVHRRDQASLPVSKAQTRLGVHHTRIATPGKRLESMDSCRENVQIYFGCWGTPLVQVVAGEMNADVVSFAIFCKA